MSGGGPARDVACGPYTVRDLDALPEGGKGFELEDGWLIELSPSPWQNWAGQRLSRIIEEAAAEAGAEVFVGVGGEWEIGTPAGIRKPGTFVVPREVARAAIEERSLRQIPGRELLFVAEVVSPGSGSERTDRVRKVSEYAALGVPQYWIVDLEPHPRVRLLDLHGDAYQQVGLIEAGTVVTAVLEADKPVTVTFDPADLARFA
ncbi:Uma2 family endonuclease [Actinomadura scrupuli]|uniref:Uma2 family endonuclease n=1 Tax=Actinomadura scrupuli TaxID=559629 RepID=UPI003D968162